ncbi:MAG: hypothetical protein FWD15_00965 [Alphaproteobacteria bacterium]|nr:hypothetical protein [Alphaproteobacteria bacterium]
MRGVVSYAVILAFALLGATEIHAQPRGAATGPGTATSAVPVGVQRTCDACLNMFSIETLDFGEDQARCLRALAQCSRSNLARQCEPVINECIAANCSLPGSCTDAMANRGLFIGCLRARNKFLPFQCAAMIAGLASSLEAEKAAEVEGAERDHERNMMIMQAEAQAAAARAATADSEIQMQMAREQAASAERIRQAEIAAAAQLEAQRFQQEQAAIAASAALDRQSAVAERNERPDVAFNNAMSMIRKAISDARSRMGKLFSMMGIVKFDGSEGHSTILHFKTPAAEIDSEILAGITCDIKDGIGNCRSEAPRAMAAKRSSRYFDPQGTYPIRFKCTRNVKESTVRGELESIYQDLDAAARRIAEQVALVEMTSLDGGSIGDDKLSALISAQMYLTEVIQKINEYGAPLTTSCMTLCEGANALEHIFTAQHATPTRFDAKGNIIRQEAAGGYNCKEFEQMTITPGIGGMLAGKVGNAGMIGGINHQAMELTERVLRAVVQVDFSLNEAEIKIAYTQDEAAGGGMGGGGGRNVQWTSNTCGAFTSKQTPGPEMQQCLSELSEIMGGSPNSSSRSQVRNMLDRINTLLPPGCPGNNFGPCCASVVPSANNTEEIRQCIYNLGSKIAARMPGGSGGGGSWFGGGGGDFRIIRINVRSSGNTCALDGGLVMQGSAAPTSMNASRLNQEFTNRKITNVRYEGATGKDVSCSTSLSDWIGICAGSTSRGQPISLEEFNQNNNQCMN